jgi:hypothetical protein
MTRRPIVIGLLVALFGWLVPVSAAPLPYEWRRWVGVSLADVATDDSGLTFATGETRIDEEHRGFLVAAFDAGGTELWRDTWLPLPDEPSGTMGKAVSIGPDGNVYAVGFGWHCRFGCESGGWFIRSYTREGELRWMRQAAGWKTRARQSEATGIDSWSGGLVITGFEYDDDVGPTDSWIRAYDADGDLTWKASVDVRGATDLREGAMDVATARSGAVFVAGYVEPDRGGPIGSNDDDPFIAGFDPGGGRRWTRVVREHGDLDDDAATSIDVRGGILAVGGTLGAPIGYGVDPPHVGWLARLSFAGVVRWMRSWGVARPQTVEDLALASSGRVTTIGGLDRHGYALVMRTYTGHGALVASQVIDPTEGSLVGRGISIDASGASIVGTRYRNAYLDPGVGGRLWRLTTGGTR